MSPASLTIIVATDRTRGIGIRNTLPWKLREDLAFFKQTTTGHAIIMGRKTFESIGRPLPNRRSIVVSRNPDWKHEGVETVTSLEAAQELLNDSMGFVIGGGEIYQQALPLAERLLVTEIDSNFECDAFFPQIDEKIWQETVRKPYHSDENGFDYAFVTYERRSK